MADTMVGRAPLCPCDFWVTELSGSVFAAGRMLAYFRVAVPSGNTVCGENVVIRSSIASGATFTANRLMYLYASNDTGSAAPAGDASFIRFEDGGDDPYHAVIELAGNTLYFIYSASNYKNAYNKAGTVANIGGWIKCSIGGNDRYIALYGSVS